MFGKTLFLVTGERFNMMDVSVRGIVAGDTFIQKRHSAFFAILPSQTQHQSSKSVVLETPSNCFCVEGNTTTPIWMIFSGQSSTERERKFSFEFRRFPDTFKGFSSFSCWYLEFSKLAKNVIAGTFNYVPNFLHCLVILDVFPYKKFFSYIKSFWMMANIFCSSWNAPRFTKTINSSNSTSKLQCDRAYRNFLGNVKGFKHTFCYA